jgi:anti-sigma factor RsiW
MNCEEAKNLIHPLIDGELDAQHAGAVEAHVESCASCAAELSSLRELQDKIAAAHLGFRAPKSLRRGIEDALPRPFARPSRREWLKGFGAGAGLSAIAASGAFLLLARNDADQLILSDVISAHLRSLEPDHLTDVRSASGDLRGGRAPTRPASGSQDALRRPVARPRPEPSEPRPSALLCGTGVRREPVESDRPTP